MKRQEFEKKVQELFPEVDYIRDETTSIGLGRYDFGYFASAKKVTKSPWSKCNLQAVLDKLNYLRTLREDKSG